MASRDEARPPTAGPVIPVARPVLRPIVWMGTSMDDTSALPAPVKASFGHRLGLVQQVKTPPGTKPFSG